MFFKSSLFTLKHSSKIFIPKKTIKISVQDSDLIIRPRIFDLGVVNEIFTNSEYEPQITNLGRVDNIVDVGANIGVFSIWAYRKYKPRKIISIEPEKENFRILKRNIKLNRAMGIIEAYRNAVYSSRTRVGIKKHFHNKGMHRLDLNSKSGDIKTITLKNITDDLIKGEIIDYLKIDIEGSEKHILIKDNKEIFKKNIKYVVLETHKKDGYDKKKAIKYFSSIGYKCRSRKTMWWSWFAGVDVVEAINTRNL